MSDRDVLICGTCGTQFSDLKLFIDHKQNCGNATSISNNTEVCSYVSPAQQTSHYGSQQIVFPMQGHASIVSLPVGMPHVILQASSGLSQMYRIVLEPNVSTPSQMNSNTQISQSNQMVNVLQPSNSHVETQYGAAADKAEPMKVQEIPSLSQKDSVGEENMEIEPDPLSLSNSSITLTPVNPVDSWNAIKRESSTVNFNNVPPDHMGEKGYKNLPSPSLHTEEEVATFLATQLVSQTNTPSQNLKIRENCSVSKHGISVEDSSFTHQNPEFIAVNEKVNSHPAEKSNPGNLKNENCAIGSRENVNQEGKQEQHTFQIKFFENKNSAGRGRKQLLCAYKNCGFTTMHKTDMVRHSRKHTGEKPFQCPQCGKRLSRQDKLKVHLRIHSKERPYACTEPGCTYRGNEKAHLKKHIRTHTNERPFRCQFCSYGAKDGSHLAVHLRFHTGDAPFHCQVDGCTASFKTSSDLKRHEKLHTGERPFKCFECDYASSLKANLKAHVRINHSKDKRFTCKTCPFAANSRKQIKDHEVTHSLNQQFLNSKEHNSKLCRNSEESESQEISSKFFDVSLKSLRLSKGRRTSKPVLPKNFVCIECGSDFVREDSYRSHIRQHEQKLKSEKKPFMTTEEEEASVKDKMKSVYSYSVHFQGSNPVKRVDTPQTERFSAGKEAKIDSGFPSSSVQLTNSQHSATGELQAGSATGELQAGTGQSEPFPYMITIDGIPSEYSNPPPLLKDEVVRQSHNSTPEDTVVHILSPSVNSSIPSNDDTVTTNNARLDNGTNNTIKQNLI